MDTIVLYMCVDPPDGEHQMYVIQNFQSFSILKQPQQHILNNQTFQIIKLK